MSNSTKGKTDTDMPTLVPSQSRTDEASGGMSAPSEMPDEHFAAAVASIERAPVLTPPGTAGATAAVTGVTGTWTSGVMCDATWTINETRNAYFHVAGGAWKKIFNGSDGSYMALVTLAAQAKQTGHQMNIREEADGMVHEIYLW